MTARLLTTRQAEVLAQKLLGLIPSKGFDGRYIRTGAGYSGLIGRMFDANLLSNRYGGKVTLDGCDALEANLDKLPPVDPTIGNIEAVRAAIASRRAELKAEIAHAEEAAERWRRDRDEKLERKAAAIPGRFAELLEERDLLVIDGHGDEVGKAVLLDLWRAIVEADGKL